MPPVFRANFGAGCKFWTHSSFCLFPLRLSRLNANVTCVVAPRRLSFLAIYEYIHSRILQLIYSNYNKKYAVLLDLHTFSMVQVLDVTRPACVYHMLTPKSHGRRDFDVH